MVKKDKVDKEFELFYNNLSYRRKFIKTIWMIPLGVYVGVFITFIHAIISLFYWIPFVIIGVQQLDYNYVMWRKEME